LNPHRETAARAEGAGPPPFPRATYRLQFNKDFGFASATELVPYLAGLGISHVYASPFLAARPGSTHGYDIVDHGRLNPEIGDEASFEAFIAALHAHGMGLILDFVPNHMGIGGDDNAWWLDVLEWGESSPFARFFDIDWNPATPALKGKVLLPVLGDRYGEVLENGEIELRFDADRGSFSAWYYQHRFPIAVLDYPRILRSAVAVLGTAGGDLRDLMNAFARIGRRQRSVTRAAVARREAAAAQAQLATLARERPEIASAIAAALRSLNGEPGNARSFRGLHDLLERQSYRIAYWRVASSEINYRRFFDINDLAGLSIQEPELFELSHRLVFRLITERKLQGLRLDHIDGLYDPLDYCHRLQDRVAYLIMQPAERSDTSGAPSSGTSALPHPIYLLVEKILAPHEHLPPEWPVDGTSGYEFMNQVNGLFVHPASAADLEATYERFIGRSTDFAESVVQAKVQILRNNLASELTVIASKLHRLAQQNWKTRDYTLAGIRNGLTEVISHFPVYRTYVDGNGVSERDRQYLDWAFAQARKDTNLEDLSVFDFLYAALTTDLRKEFRGGRSGREIVRIAMKFQQLTGPVMAKAFEDTALYRYHRLVSLNDVGGEPERFGVSAAAFHHMNQERLRHYPFSMLATATHDHKRGEDVRARIDVLTEDPAGWAQHVRRWRRLNRSRRREVDDRPAPSRNDEYLLYQILVGSLPFDIADASPAEIEDYAERIVGYMIKAVREAKVRSNWTSPDAGYEDAVEQFVRGILRPAQHAVFWRDLVGYCATIGRAGAVNGLAQTLLKLTSPGVPDIYQGCERWDLSLVDPDNRRPVDYGIRVKQLEQESSHPGALVREWRNGAIKQHVIARTLAVRKAAPDLLARGEYLPLEAEGPAAGHCLAYLRRTADRCLLVVVPRFPMTLLTEGDELRLAADRLADTTLQLSATEAECILSGRNHATADGRLSLATLLQDLPVALVELSGPSA